PQLIVDNAKIGKDAPCASTDYPLQFVFAMQLSQLKVVGCIVAYEQRLQVWGRFLIDAMAVTRSQYIPEHPIASHLCRVIALVHSKITRTVAIFALQTNKGTMRVHEVVAVNDVFSLEFPVSLVNADERCAAQTNSACRSL